MEWKGLWFELGRQWYRRCVVFFFSDLDIVRRVVRLVFATVRLVPDDAILENYLTNEISVTRMLLVRKSVSQPF